MRKIEFPIQFLLKYAHKRHFNLTITEICLLYFFVCLFHISSQMFGPRGPKKNQEKKGKVFSSVLPNLLSVCLHNYGLLYILLACG